VGFINWLLAQTSRISPRALTAQVSAAMFAPRATSPDASSVLAAS
jgi:hypothetical protein